MNIINTFNSLGQSLWLNYLRRAYIESGELGNLIDMGIGGVTSSPAIFERAISCSSDYDKAIQTLVKAGKPVQEIYEALVCDDSQRVADRLHPRFEVSEGWDGYVSVELNPRVMNDAVSTVAEARHVLAMVNRVNVMIEIPATEAGIEAVQILTADGVNFNATHVYSLETFERIARAYLAGLKDYLSTHSVWRMAPSSVVSFSVGRLDQKLDPILAEMGLLELQGEMGIACAKMVYKRFRELFDGPDWHDLEKRGGRLLRPKWTKTTPHRFDLAETWYVDALVGADTVMTVRPSTLQILMRKESVEPSIESGLAQAEDQLARVAEAGLDLEVIGRQIQQDSLAAFNDYFRAMVVSVSDKRNSLELGRRRVFYHLDGFDQEIAAGLTRLCDEEAMKRLWAFDTRVSSMLENPGWLHVAEVMEANVGRLESFLEQVLADGYRKMIFIGPEELTQIPEMYYALFNRTFMPTQVDLPHLELVVLDLADHEELVDFASHRELDKTLYLVVAKSSPTPQALKDLALLFDHLESQAGKEMARRSFAVITDAASDLAKFALNYGFRDLFLNDPSLDHPHVALSFYGFVPAVLAGARIRPLVDRVQRMACNASSCNCPIRGDNHAAQLGTSLFYLADSGYNNLVFFYPPLLEPFGKWLEQFVVDLSASQGLPFGVSKAASLPDLLEPGSDGTFILLSLAGDDSLRNHKENLLSQGKPVIEMVLDDLYDVVGLIFLWQVAFVVADYFVHGGPIVPERKIPAGLVA